MIKWNALVAELLLWLRNTQPPATLSMCFIYKHSVDSHIEKWENVC